MLGFKDWRCVVEWISILISVFALIVSVFTLVTNWDSNKISNKIAQEANDQSAEESYISNKIAQEANDLSAEESYERRQKSFRNCGGNPDYPNR
jgi:hypothetical protein